MCKSTEIQPLAVSVSVRETSSSYFSSIYGGSKNVKNKVYNHFLNLIFRSEEFSNTFLIAAIAEIAANGRENCEAIMGAEGARDIVLELKTFRPRLSEAN